MRMRHVMAVCLASLAIGNSVPQSLSACERCRGGHVCSTCQPSDDRGLLDRLDAFLVRRRPKLEPVTIPRLPSIDGSLCRAVAGRVACRCGAGPNCGCELNEPTCGCELHQAGRYVTHGQAGAGVAISPQPSPPSEQMNASRGGGSYSQPYSTSPPATAEQESYRPNTPKSLPASPLPLNQPKETVPRPDSEVDPFRDESAGRVRRIPARAVQHTPSPREYRQSYDAQARHEPARRSLTDDALRGQSPVPASLSRTRYQDLDAHGSSRQRAVEPIRTTPERLPEVISASGQQAAGYGRSSSDADYDSGNNAARRPAQPPTTGNANPLRGNSR